MEEKKYPKADLTRMKGLFLNIGMVVSVALVTLAIEWKTYEEQDVVNLGQVKDDFEEVMDVPPTEQPPPPPPKVQQPEIIEVPDEEEIEEEIEVDLDVEIEEETVVEDVVFDDEPQEEKAEEVFNIVEDNAEFPGGISAFYKYVQDKLKYPSQARRMGIEGRVYVQFVIDTDGTITQVEAIKGVGAGCDDEAVRIIEQSPKWKPGKQRGRAVKQRMVLPITFKLN